MKSAHRPEGPREETRKKMRPVKREEFTELVHKAIRTPSKKASGKNARSQQLEQK